MATAEKKAKTLGVKVVILGAGGLVGSRLARYCVAQTDINVSSTETAPLTKISLFDMKEPAHLGDLKADERVEMVVGDLTDKATMQGVLDPTGYSHVTTIHLAALLSGYSEDDFDLGMKINLFGTINVMECVRELKDALGAPQCYVYASTDYVTCFNDFNKKNPCTEESFRLSPVSYGCQKACNELLICDYSRKGFIDGRVGRLSAVIGRPGWSNSISYPFTGIFTQTLEGKDYVVPLPMDVPYPCSSLQTDVECFFALAGKIDAAQLGHNRVVQLPAKTFTLADIWAAAQDVAKEKAIEIGKIEVKVGGSDTTVTEINVCPYVDCGRAASLGLPTEVDLRAIIRDYVETYIQKS
eukprot:m.356781 g.356781  ORF g.356781 m.356781 type:complete len:355 (+) comp17624_c0_seq1:74-1138(+)